MNELEILKQKLSEALENVDYYNRKAQAELAVAKALQEAVDKLETKNS